jgi:hypothetical protein
MSPDVLKLINKEIIMQKKITASLYFSFTASALPKNNKKTASRYRHQNEKRQNNE